MQEILKLEFPKQSRGSRDRSREWWWIAELNFERGIFLYRTVARWVERVRNGRLRAVEQLNSQQSGRCRRWWSNLVGEKGVRVRVGQIVTRQVRDWVYLCAVMAPADGLVDGQMASWLGGFDRVSLTPATRWAQTSPAAGCGNMSPWAGRFWVAWAWRKSFYRSLPNLLLLHSAYNSCSRALLPFLGFLVDSTFLWVSNVPSCCLVGPQSARCQRW